MTIPAKPHTEPPLTPRPGIEEETNLLNKSCTAADAAIEGILNGRLKPSEANALLGGGRMYQNAAKTGFGFRMARSRVVAQEAQTVEGTTA